MSLEEIRVWAYFIITIILVYMLYSYAYHLYTTKKKTGKDYEDYGKMALNDELIDKPIEPLNNHKNRS